MITEADVRKLRAIRTPGPSVLSLYLWVPVDLPALRGLPARADELLAEAAEGTDDRRAVKARRLLRGLLAGERIRRVWRSWQMSCCRCMNSVSSLP
jgi:hypothetical protein